MAMDKILDKAGPRKAKAPQAGLAALERAARHDLARLNYPAANWVPGEGVYANVPGTLAVAFNCPGPSTVR